MRGCKGKDVWTRWHDRDGEVHVHERQCGGGGVREVV